LKRQADYGTTFAGISGSGADLVHRLFVLDDMSRSFAFTRGKMGRRSDGFSWRPGHIESGAAPAPRAIRHASGAPSVIRTWRLDDRMGQRALRSFLAVAISAARRLDVACGPGREFRFDDYCSNQHTRW